MLLSHKNNRTLGGGKIQEPTFGALLRRMRDDRGVSRDRLAKAANVSASYITHLEFGQRDRPTHSVVEALTGFLHEVHPLNSAERRHLFDLAGLGEQAQPSVEDLRAALSPSALEALHRHDPWPAVYLDTRSNILACNDSYPRFFPGIRDSGSILRWVFRDPRSRRTLLEWEHEATLTVGLVQGFMGRSEHPGWWADTIAELSEVPDFQRIWNSTGAWYGRDPAWMTLRHPDSGEPMQLDLRVFPFESAEYRDRILFVAGFGIATPTE